MAGEQIRFSEQHFSLRDFYATLGGKRQNEVLIRPVIHCVAEPRG
jgi:hypothetical protein